MLQLTPFWSRLFWEHPFPRQPPAHHGLGAEVFLPQESDTGRELSICLFQYVMGLATGARKEEMKKEMWETLLLLVFHLRDQKENVAKAAQEALCFTGRFLKWQELTELARTAKPWEISKCLLERKRRKTKDFLHQSEVYLQSPQEILRQDTVRFIGLIGQHVDECRTTEYIKQGE
ncbi:maestro heat-like repeat-containing protein family member 7 isoform 1-T1 [Ara ararauna]